MSPSNVPFLSPRLRSPATRPLGPGPLCLSAFNPVTGRSPCLLGEPPPATPPSVLGLRQKRCIDRHEIHCFRHVAAAGDSCGLFAAFGDLEDESKLGELPSDDDLLLRFFDPQPHLLQQPLFAENDNGAQPLAPAVTALWPTHAASLHNLGGSGAAQRGAVRSLAPAAPLPFLYLDEPAGMIHGGVKRSSELPDRKDVVEAKRAAVWEQSEDADSPRSTLHRHRSLPARPQAAPSPHAAARGGSSSRSAAEPAAAGDSSAQASPGLVFRGVSRHRLTQRWEASLWLAGRQLYLGGFDSQGDAARAYDLAALACKGLDAVINYPPAEYAQQLADIKDFTRVSARLVRCCSCRAVVVRELSACGCLSVAPFLPFLPRCRRRWWLTCAAAAPPSAAASRATGACRATTDGGRRASGRLVAVRT